MPAVVRPEDWALWLGEEPATLDELRALLIARDYDWSAAKNSKTPTLPNPVKPKDDNQPTIL